MKSSPDRRILGLALVAAILIFAADLWVVLGVAAAVPYVIVVWLAYVAGSPRGLRLAAVSTSLLALLGGVLSPPGAEIWQVAANRAVALLAIWSTAIPCLRSLRLLEKETERAEHAEEAAREIARQRGKDARRARAMANILEDLNIERTRLVASEQRFRMTVDSSLDAVVTIGPDGVITGWNPQAEHTFGWTREEAVGQPLVELIVPERYRDACREGFGRFQETGQGKVLGQRSRLSALRRDGEEIPVELAVSALELTNGHGASAFIRDITEQQRAEETRNRLAALIEFSEDAIVGKNLDGVVTSWNHGAEVLYGYSAEEMIGQSIARVIPEDRSEELRRILARLRRRKPIKRFETKRLAKDGRVLDVSLTISPVTGADGQVVGASSIARDIAHRKRIQEERRHLLEELERSNVELRQFAYVASHDLQTPLRSIVGFAQFLQSEYQGKLDDTADGYLDRIVAGVHRMQQLIRDLLEYSRVKSRAREFVPTSLNDAFDDAVTLLRASIAESEARVTRGELPLVMGDPAQLSQLFQNLIGNGIKYHGEERPEVHVSATAGKSHWTLEVRDNGIGIDPEHHDRIFEVFRRLHTQKDYPGTGIGLAVCRRIVQRHGGKLWVESESGKGSTFYFTIPASDVDATVMS